MPASARRFLKFNLSTALTSIGGNVVMMAILVGILGMPPIAANVLAVAALSVANVVVSDRWVFRSSAVPSACCLVLVTPPAAHAAPRVDTLDAWSAYVSTVGTRIEQAMQTPRPGGAPSTACGAGLPSCAVPTGATIDVAGGTISHWRGSVFLRGMTLDELLHRLQNPGTPPPQEDVAASRVLARGPDWLRVSIRLIRSAIVTVTYDTEHVMTFRRWTPTLASATSVATRIDEVGGSDHGFLWRLNSYWRYEQAAGGVLVGLESLTLSRAVPGLLRPIAGRVVPRIARESMVRTLDALHAYERR